MEFQRPPRNIAPPPTKIGWRASAIRYAITFRQEAQRRTYPADPRLAALQALSALLQVGNYFEVRDGVCSSIRGPARDRPKRIRHGPRRGRDVRCVRSRPPSAAWCGASLLPGEALC